MAAHRALVTGGGTGIGYATAEALAKEGCDVVIAGRRPEVLADACRRLEEVAPGAQVASVVADMSSPEDPGMAVGRAAELLGGLDLLVAAAATCAPEPTLGLDAERWDSVVDVALRGAALCSIAAVREMRGSGGGRIVLITSIDEEVTEPSVAHYSAAKAGLAAFMRSLALEAAPFGVVVNAVAPGWVETPTARPRLEKASPESLARLNFLQRPGKPEEIASIILYLALRAPPFLIGETIRADGGQVIRAAMP